MVLRGFNLTALVYAVKGVLNNVNGAKVFVPEVAALTVKEAVIQA